jgi:CheY-like chemotaxis protein
MTPDRRLRVLIADDDEDQLIVRSLLLECAGFSVARASDVVAALRSAEANQPDCAIVDLRLPTEAAGLSLLRDLRTLNGKLELFVLTGADPKSLMASPEAKLVREVLLKPVPSGRLIECLKMVESQMTAGVRSEKDS